MASYKIIDLKKLCEILTRIYGDGNFCFTDFFAIQLYAENLQDTKIDCIQPHEINISVRGSVDYTKEMIDEHKLNISSLLYCREGFIPINIESYDDINIEIVAGIPLQNSNDILNYYIRAEENSYDIIEARNCNTCVNVMNDFFRTKSATV